LFKHKEAALEKTGAGTVAASGPQFSRSAATCLAPSVDNLTPSVRFEEENITVTLCGETLGVQTLETSVEEPVG